MKASKSMLVPYAELFEVLILLNNFGYFGGVRKTKS